MTDAIRTSGVRPNRLLKALFLLTLAPSPALASLPRTDEQARRAADVAGLGGTESGSLIGLIGTTVSALLFLVGVVFLVLIVYAGFLWMTAGGKDDQVGTAKRILTGSVIGMLIVFAAYAITEFILAQTIFSTI
ncbi:MAG: hypothetical protein ABIJ46_04895 [bacterium]